MDWQFTIFLSIVGLSYIYAFFSGVGDAANALATTVASRALTLQKAIYLGFSLQFLGALAGTGVALTISKGLVDLNQINLEVVLSAVLAMLIWSAITYYYSIPVSDTHSLVGSLLGAALAWHGREVLLWSGVVIVLLAMLFSPILGLFGGYLGSKVVTKITHFQKTTKMRHLFKNLQIVMAAFTSFSNGLNNGQKPMGLIIMALTLYYGSNQDILPFWVILSVAFVQAIGVIYGARLIKTVGLKIAKVSPEQGFSAQASAVFVLQLASWFGIPISSTQVITTALVGASVSRRFSSVRWVLVQDIIRSWFLTLPVSFGFGFVISSLLNWFV